MPRGFKVVYPVLEIVYHYEQGFCDLFKLVGEFPCLRAAHGIIIAGPDPVVPRPFFCRYRLLSRGRADIVESGNQLYQLYVFHSNFLRRYRIILAYVPAPSRALRSPARSRPHRMSSHPGRLHHLPLILILSHFTLLFIEDIGQPHNFQPSLAGCMHPAKGVIRNSQQKELCRIGYEPDRIMSVFMTKTAKKVLKKGIVENEVSFSFSSRGG